MMNRGKITITPDRIAVMLSTDGTVWMTVEEITTIFHVTVASVERRITKLLAKGELDGRKVKTEEVKIHGGRRYIAEYYNLDMVIALFYRIDTPASKAFRKWVGERVIRSLKKEGAPPLILRIAQATDGIN
ncbi:MAG: lipofamily protein [Alistipes senegalensis]|nr:lipofamily protein [Bacteroides cellulosilyticus]MCM1352942.1 lipofamily protein [Alistipes senegalensis]